MVVDRLELVDELEDPVAEGKEEGEDDGEAKENEPGVLLEGQEDCNKATDVPAGEGDEELVPGEGRSRTIYQDEN